jgi:hypothetical protein
MIFASSLLFNCWEFATRHPGILLVLFGVGGEVVFDWKDMKGRLAWAKRLSAIVLIAGLILEFSEAAKSDKEVSAAIERAGLAEQKAGEANDRAANTESNNLVLQSQLLKLEAKTKWRTITPEDKKRFVDITQAISKFPVRVRMAANASSEVKSYAQKIREMLDDGGFVETNKELAIAEWPPDMNLLYKGGLPEIPSVMFINNLTTTSDIIDCRDAAKTLKLFTNPPPTIKTVVVFTNTDFSPPPQVLNDCGEPVLVFNVASRGIFKMMEFQRVQSCFADIGITTQMITTTNIPDGVCEVFINPKF